MPADFQSAQCKRFAKSLLPGRMLRVTLASLLAGAVSMVYTVFDLPGLSVDSLITAAPREWFFVCLSFVLVLLVTEPMQVSLAAMSLRVTRTGERPSPLRVCDCFAEGYGHILGVCAWRALWQTLWLVPCALPMAFFVYFRMPYHAVAVEEVLLWLLVSTGLYLYRICAYRFVDCICADEPTLSARETLNRSKALTRGRRMDIFRLELSFVGWYLLTLVTMGVAVVFVRPYYCFTFASVYDRLRGEALPPFAGPDDIARMP